MNQVKEFVHMAALVFCVLFLAVMRHARQIGGRNG